jgi:hypothetical protein
MTGIGGAAVAATLHVVRRLAEPHRTGTFRLACDDVLSREIQCTRRRR